MFRKVIDKLRGAQASEGVDDTLALARAHLEADRPQQALEVLDALLARAGEHAEALYLRGTARLEMQRPLQALPDLQRAAAIDPGDPRRHYNLARTHWDLDQVAACQRALRAALAADPGFAPAREFLGNIGLSGAHYSDALARIHQYLKPRTYIEIGVHKGHSLALARRETVALGIDPEPLIEVVLGPNQRVYAETSDAFFAGRDVLALLGGQRVELAFIDGMHRFEFALRDFMNLEPLCARDAVVLVHDVFPLDRETAARERTTTFWSGDVWRLLLLLKKHRPDLSIDTIAAPPSGLALIRNLDPDSTVIRDNLAALVEEFMALDYSALEAGKSELLNLYANEWNEIQALLGPLRARP